MDSTTVGQSPRSAAFFASCTKCSTELVPSLNGFCFRCSSHFDISAWRRPLNFSWLFNLKTAKMLGLIIPPSLLTTADEVIE